MSALLTRDQADLLAAYGWQTADLLLDPDEAISAARGSMSCAVGEPWSWRTGSKGIVGRRGRHAMVGDDARDDDVVVPWPLLRAAAKASPADLAADLRRARRRTRRELQRTVAPYLPGGYAPFVQPPPEWHRRAQTAQQRATREVLAVLSGQPAIRTRIGPNPPHRPTSVETWLWSRCWDCDWYTAHVEERHAMEHTIEVQEHRCGGEPVQLDLFGSVA